MSDDKFVFNLNYVKPTNLSDSELIRFRSACFEIYRLLRGVQNNEHNFVSRPFTSFEKLKKSRAELCCFPERFYSFKFDRFVIEIRKVKSGRYCVCVCGCDLSVINKSLNNFIPKLSFYDKTFSSGWYYYGFFYWSGFTKNHKTIPIGFSFEDCVKLYKDCVKMFCYAQSNLQYFSNSPVFDNGVCHV